MAQKQILDLTKHSSKYDSKHINNLSAKKVPAKLLQELENGCSLETLEKLAKGYPICKYETQITIHGIFDDLNTRRVGTYVNLTKNKNKSLGVRWTAIDHDKKTDLFSMIHQADKSWYPHEDSQCYLLRKMEHCPNKEIYQDILKQYKDKAASINTSLFTGVCSAYGMRDMFGRLYACMDLNIQCFPVKNLDQIAQNVTEMDAATISKAIQEEQERQAKKRAAEEAYYQELKAKQEQEAKERKARQEKFMADNPIPAEFKLMNDYVLKVGDIMVAGLSDKYGDMAYSYVKIVKSFGRLLKVPCDQQGNKTGSGCELLRQKISKGYVKAA